jgi:hypothetical protein
MGPDRGNGAQAQHKVTVRDHTALTGSRVVPFLIDPSYRQSVASIGSDAQPKQALAPAST